jgi:competence protein ComFC
MSAGMIAALADIFYPWPMNCAACGQRTGGRGLLCDSCRAGQSNFSALVNFAHAPGIDASVAAHMYTKQAAAMVRGLKYGAVRALAREMADDMLDAAHFAGFSAPDAVTYVPMHWTRRRNRFYNHAQLLAELVAVDMGAAAVRGIVRVRPCRQQAKLRDDAARRENVRGAFRARMDFSGKRVLLVDDVYTTGATAGECAMALRMAGAETVMLLTYATAYKSHNG